MRFLNLRAFATASAAALALGGVAATTASAPVAAAGTIPAYDHVVLAIFENHKQSQIIGSSNAPYLTSLASQGANLTQSFAIEHPSEPNYLDLFSGSNQGVTDDSCPHTFATDNLGHQLIAAGKTFKAYSEGLPSVGSLVCTNSATSYARKHNPWTNFSDLDQNTVNLPYTSFPTDFTTLPTHSWVVPNLCNDMHDCSVATGDAWAQSHLDAYAQWAKTHNSLLIVTFDEDDSTGANQVATVLVGDHITPGIYTEHIDHFTVLRTIEDMYGLAPLGAAASRTAITDVFSTGTTAVTVTNPGSRTGTVGTATSLQLAASGGTGPYSWTATGLPSGLSISSSGLISGTPTAAGSFSVNATATDSLGATGSTAFSWTIAPATSCSGQLLGNPGFETGSASPWTATSGVVSNLAAEPAHSGTWDAWLDGNGSRTTDTLAQSVSIPSGCHATLTFWLHVDTAETTTRATDKLTVAAGSTTLATYSNLNKATGYSQKSFDVSAFAGQTVNILFSGVEDKARQTSFVVDDASLAIS